MERVTTTQDPQSVTVMCRTASASKHYCWIQDESTGEVRHQVVRPSINGLLSTFGLELICAEGRFYWVRFFRIKDEMSEALQGLETLGAVSIDGDSGVEFLLARVGGQDFEDEAYRGRILCTDQQEETGYLLDGEFVEPDLSSEQWKTPELT